MLALALGLATPPSCSRVIWKPHQACPCHRAQGEDSAAGVAGVPRGDGRYADDINAGAVLRAHRRPVCPFSSTRLPLIQISGFL